MAQHFAAYSDTDSDGQADTGSQLDFGRLEGFVASAGQRSNSAGQDTRAAAGFTPALIAAIQRTASTVAASPLEPPGVSSGARNERIHVAPGVQQESEVALDQHTSAMDSSIRSGAISEADFARGEQGQSRKRPLLNDQNDNLGERRQCMRQRLKLQHQDQQQQHKRQWSQLQDQQQVLPDVRGQLPQTSEQWPGPPTAVPAVSAARQRLLDHSLRISGRAQQVQSQRGPLVPQQPHPRPSRPWPAPQGVIDLTELQWVHPQQQQQQFREQQQQQQQGAPSALNLPSTAFPDVIDLTQSERRQPLQHTQHTKTSLGGQRWPERRQAAPSGNSNKSALHHELIRFADQVPIPT